MKQNKKSKMKNILLTFWVDAALNDKINKYLEKSGMTRTNFIKRLIIKFLDKQ